MEHCRVLIVDDEKKYADEVAYSLSHNPDFTVVGVACDGAEAAKLTWQFLPDVVLMDIKMPVMDGIEATRVIKLVKPKIEVVILTIQENDISLFEALKAGAKGYLLKSSSNVEIANALLAVASGESAIPPFLGRRVLIEFERLSQQTSALLSLVEKLTKTEMVILGHIAEGKTNPQIAQVMDIAVQTVKNHLTDILCKLEANSRFEAAYIARQSGIRGSLYKEEDVAAMAPGTRPISFQLGEQHLQRLKREAAKYEMSASSYVRQLVINMLEKI